MDNGTVAKYPGVLLHSHVLSSCLTKIYNQQIYHQNKLTEEIVNRIKEKSVFRKLFRQGKNFSPHLDILL